MTASKPQDLPDLFLRALNSGDVDAVSGLYEPDAVVAPDPGRVVSGRTSIKEIVAEFLAGKPRFVLHDTEVVQAGDIALIRSRWSVSKPDSAGPATDMSVVPTLVARRQPEGNWLVVIDRPLV